MGVGIKTLEAVFAMPRPGDATPAIWFPSVRTGSGTDTFTERLAEALERRGYRALVSWLPHRAEFAPWSVTVPERPAWANIVHANSWLSTRFVPRDMPMIATIHLCVHGTSSVPRAPAQALYHRTWIRRQEGRLLRRAEIVTAVSSHVARDTALAFRDIAPQVVHNGLSDDPAWRASRKERQPGPFRLLYCGNWSSRKGVDLLDPLMHALGDGFELLYTPDRHGGTAGHRLPPNARSLGRLGGGEALAQAYRQADVLVFPSRLEGLPLVPIEAMACGLPVVATDASSVTDIVQHGVTGFLVPADDIGAFAAAIVQLRDAPALWSSMSEASRRRQAEAFSEEAMLAGYLDAYRRAIARQGVRAA